jgi:hypothetical protein
MFLVCLLMLQEWAVRQFWPIGFWRVRRVDRCGRRSEAALGFPRGCALVVATWQTICVPMPIRLHCDFPGCGRSVKVAVSPGTRQFDLRTTTWWIVGSATACCENHLVFDPPVTHTLPTARFSSACIQRNGAVLRSVSPEHRITNQVVACSWGDRLSGSRSARGREWKHSVPGVAGASSVSAV